ncbi:MAG: hypothetical protein KDA21_10000, partial [Phycisphaerales bacterium]|nr:hypothetical protein [Phycisphaerales bacterium]
MKSGLCVGMLLLIGAAAWGQERPEEIPFRPADVFVPDPERGGSGEGCGGAVTVSGASIALEFNNDLNAANGPPGSCNSGSATVMQNDFWIRFTAPANGMVRVTVTDLDSYDMIMQVYSGNCSNLNPLFCLDEPEPMTG